MPESLSPSEAGDVLDGARTLSRLFMPWLWRTHEEHGKDVTEYVVPSLVATMRRMPDSVRPAAIPTWPGWSSLRIRGLHPTLRRKQYGKWTDGEMTPPEVTAFLQAEHIDRTTEAPGFATRVITDALSGVGID